MGVVGGKGGGERKSVLAEVCCLMFFFFRLIYSSASYESSNRRSGLRCVGREFVDQTFITKQSIPSNKVQEYYDVLQGSRAS